MVPTPTLDDGLALDRSTCIETHKVNIVDTFYINSIIHIVLLALGSERRGARLEEGAPTIRPRPLIPRHRGTRVTIYPDSEYHTVRYLHAIRRPIPRALRSRAKLRKLTRTRNPTHLHTSDYPRANTVPRNYSQESLQVFSRLPCRDMGVRSFRSKRRPLVSAITTPCSTTVRLGII